MNYLLTRLLGMLLATAGGLGAQPEIYFGEDVSPWPVGSPNDVPKPTNFTHTFEAGKRFFSRLPGVPRETFEEFPTFEAPPALVFGDTIATLEGDDFVYSYNGLTNAVNGGFAFSGTNTLGLRGGMGEFLSLSFSSPQAAFGFYGCDVEVNELRLTFIGADGSRTDVAVPVTRPQGSGGAFFFGLIDKNNPFVGVEFQNRGEADDGFDLDDLTIAAAGQICPEPATLSAALYAGLEIRGTPGETYRVEYTTDLPSASSAQWTVLTNLVLPASPYFHLDREPATACGRRFYRAVAECP